MRSSVRPVLVTSLIAIVIGIACDAAAEKKIGVDLAGEPKQQHVAPAGAVFLELYPLLPEAKYKVAEDDEFDAPKAGDDSNPVACQDPEKHIWKQIKAAKTEIDVANAFVTARSNFAACTVAEREAMNAAIDKVRATLTRTVALKGKIEPPVEREITRVAKGAAATNKETWTVFVVKGPAGDPDLLNEIEKRMAADQNSTVLECAYPTGECEDHKLFVNADHVSAIVIRGIPTNKKLKLIADPMSEPFEKCEVLRQNSIEFTDRKETPNVLVVTMHMFRKPLLGHNPGRRRAAALRLYGWSDLDELTPTQIAELCKTSDLTVGEKIRRMGLTNASATVEGKPINRQRVLLKTEGYQIEESTAIPIVVDGRMEQVTVTLFVEGEDPKVFVVRFFYQRWWVDGGGAFLFSRIHDERLITISDPNNSGKLKVEGLKSETNFKPQTGIVVNLHPGNYPEFAIQWGLSTGANSELSYYLGPALRLREIGKRGLATFSAGVALTPNIHFPDLRPGNDNIDPMDARLKGTRNYSAQLYFGISLGFNFGGVVAGADAVKEVPEP